MSTTLADLTHIPLAEAYICCDCSCIGNCAEWCPACTSEALIGLAAVLEREDKDVDAQ